MRPQMLVTFIGGSANLTQKVVECFSPYIDVPVMPRLGYPELAERFPPQQAVCRVERYIVRQVGRDHAVAILDHLS